jgi:hypothetical protein
MISDKCRIEIFIRCKNRIKNATSALPTLMKKGGHHIGFLDQCQEDIITNTPMPETTSDEDFDQYESEMYDTMLTILKEETEAYEVPAVQEEIQSMNRIIKELENFKEQITEKEPNYDHEIFDGFDDFGIVVSSDPNWKGRDQDFILLMANTRPVVWLIQSLKSVCADFLTYRKNEDFFYAIAKLAASYLNSNDELSNTTQFFMEGVQFARKQVEFHIQSLNRLLEDFEIYWEEKESDTEDDW